MQSFSWTWTFYVEFMQYPSGGSRIFQTGGANVQGGGRQPIIWPNVPENCMKMEEIGPRGRRAPLYPPKNLLTF